MITPEILTDGMVEELLLHIEYRRRDLQLLEERCKSCLRYPVGDHRVDADSLARLRQRICDAINNREVMP